MDKDAERKLLRDTLIWIEEQTSELSSRSNEELRQLMHKNIYRGIRDLARKALKGKQ